LKSYQFTPSASQDLDEITDYLEAERPGTSANLIDTIREKCRLLVQFPEMGRLRDEIAPNVRSILAGSYLIFYRPTQDALQIVRILHGARDIKNIWNEDAN
jgi:toxin ParE1/3/4